MGGNESLKADVRVIGATNKDLDSCLKKMPFAKTSSFASRSFPSIFRPLKRRREDIVPLAEHFLTGFAQSMGKPNPGFTEPAKVFLRKQEWPGNVRELENSIERAVIHSPDGTIDVNHLTFPVLR